MEYIHLTKLHNLFLLLKLGYFQEYSEASRNKQLEHFLQMSLLHQTEKQPQDPFSGHHGQHFMSQFQNGSKRLRTENNGSLEPKHPLFSRGVCTWAGCETNCDTYSSFIAHLNRDHVLDERSTAQTRVQV